jgi:hypothetical protein
MTQSDGRRTDSWANPANWEGGRMPAESDGAIVGPGVKAQLHHSQPSVFSGSLLLQDKASLHLWSGASEALLPTGNSRLIMSEDSQLVLRSKQESELGPVEVIGTATVYGGLSTSGHHQTRRFTSPVSGSGSLVLMGVDGTVFSLESANSFTGGLATRSEAGAPFKVICTSDEGLGKGPVVIGPHASLHLTGSLTDGIADDATLRLTGPKGSLKTKLVLDTPERIAAFFIEGDDQGEGTFSRHTHPEFISGDGKLIVKSP